MKDEYIIINRTALEKRIKELEEQLKTLGDTYEEEIHAHGYLSGEINQLKKIMSQSTPLIPEIKKSLFDAFTDAPERGTKEYAKYVSDYISNLKLDI